jgi:F-type H+-transporting ATPase subunit epsilon
MGFAWSGLKSLNPRLCSYYLHHFTPRPWPAKLPSVVQEFALAKTFRCSIVTPDAAVFDEDVTYASFPAWDGQQGMMAGQSPLLTRLGVGSLRLDLGAPGSNSRWFLIDGGFAQVQDNNLTLLTEKAVPAEKLSLQEGQAELAEANARVTKPGEDRARVERDQQRALAKTNLARAASQRGSS